MITLKTTLSISLIVSAIFQVACNNPQTNAVATDTIKPIFVTDAVRYDSDDPAIWINKADPSKSLVIATDKDADGALFVYDLAGKIVKDKVVPNLKRPNNVDVAYGLILNGKPVDIAVTTERMTHKLRIFSLPDMKPIDQADWICLQVKQRLILGISWALRCILHPKDRFMLLWGGKMVLRMAICGNTY
ncbi:phytase [Sphingobacterium sp. IITKGP-BTPF85]|uniref:phytase n=1 Tax=Sphingobacterium sp. IITKGP-BTPF85 TaxID=1338009 RepID=UPI000429A91C|nr:phytase [Sphingobacterium sp. IITKGP-BTPF85]KKX52336.1 hypothetical protein L950_0200130 [Sphingobacterium sp. IITKGP-BTPF85]